MKIVFADNKSNKKTDNAASFVVLVGEGNSFAAIGKNMDKQAGGALSKAAASSRFTGKRGQFLSIPAPAGLPCARVILAGVGKEKDWNRLAAESLGGGLVVQLNNSGAKQAMVLLEAGKGDIAETAARIGFGAQLRSYRFDKYRTKEKAEDKPTLAGMTIVLPDSKNVSAAKQAFEHLEVLANSVAFTRNLVSEPANIIHPESLAAECKQLSKVGLQVEVLGEAEMKKLGMGSLLGVGQGSIRESKLVVMRWNGAPNDKKQGPVAFVGKGVTFDTGGISIKPAAGMEDMKWDMAGSAVVIGLMRTLALRKAKVNAVGVVGLVENMPDGNAQRPGDVVTSMSGQTIEVINTDAEGRLVLADALWYTQSKYKPRFMVNLATLTGAIIIALGSSRAGLFSNNDKLAQQLSDTGKKVGEEVWRLPLGDVYDKQINSDIADMKNVGEGREAGSITAAQFLQRFVNEVPWAHLDIAGVAWTNKPLDTVPKGATAFGVRLLDELVSDYYEA